MATLRSNKVASAFGDVRQALARKLVAAAVMLVSEHKKRLSVGNPAPHDSPSRPGEYPRARTGFGRAQVDFEPKAPAAVATSLEVVVGLREPGWYLEHLAAERDRLGLTQTAADLRARLEALIAGEVRP